MRTPEAMGADTGYSGAVRHGRPAERSAARRARTFMSADGAIRSVTHAPEAETRATARYDVVRSGRAGSSLAFTRMMSATGRARRPTTRHSARGPTLENADVITLE